MGQLRRCVVAFVLGFGCCAALARLLVTEPAAAGSRTRFAVVSPADVVAVAARTVVSLEAFPPGPAAPPGVPRGGWGASRLQPTGVGSGVLISADGHILTNHHVIAGAGRLRARLADGREFTAAVAGSDPHSDLALVRIAARGIPFARFGSSRRLRPGDPVVAIGNPLGFDHSVSAGVVSACRPGPFNVDGVTLGDMIQTDAAINQGNSGGGLFDARGLLVGINTATMLPRGSGGSIGIGFAIPADRARPVAEALMREGRVPRPWLGIRYRLPRLPSFLHRLGGAGIVVQSVVPGSPAERAGLRRDDLLRRLGRCPIRGPDDIYTFLESHRAGETVEAVVRRGAREVRLPVRLAALPPPASAAARS